MLTYSILADCVNEYLKIGESTTIECMKKFTAGVIQVFGEEYLLKPTQADVDRLLVVAEARDFPSMLEAQIVCIVNGRTVQRGGKVPLQRAYIESPQSFSRRLPLMIFGYDMPCLDAREPSIT